MEKGISIVLLFAAVHGFVDPKQKKVCKRKAGSKIVMESSRRVAEKGWISEKGKKVSHAKMWGCRK